MFVKPMMKYSKINMGMLGLYTIFIAYVSLAGGSTEESYVPDLNSFGIDGLDKILHFLAYMVFAGLALLSFDTRKKVHISYIGIILYSLALEFIQSTMPLREASFPDFLANSLGVIFVFALQNRFKLRYST